MADSKKVSELQRITEAGAEDVIYIVANGKSYQIKTSDFKDDLSNYFNITTGDTDDITEGEINKFMLQAERDKLGSIDALEDQVNSILSLINKYGEVLSTTPVTAKESYFDVFRYIEDVPDSLALTSISFNYGVLKTISDKYYFVSKKDNTVQFKNNRIYINDLEQFINFNDPDLETSDFLAWEVNLNDNSFLDNEFYRFNFWFIKQEVSSIIVFGNPFSLLKHPSNNNPEFKNKIQKNDIICDGYLDNNTLWLKATCVNDTDINNPDNWLLHDSLDITINIPE